MLYAVVPAQNEAGSVKQVIINLIEISVDVILPVVNGSTDNTLTEVTAFSPEKVKPIVFTSALGLDVPRAIGASYALDAGATTVLFIDGDMAQVPKIALHKLVKSITDEGVATDMALINCYPPEAPPPDTPVTRRLVYYRKELTRCLGLPELGSASPAHGPHALSRRLLQAIPRAELAIPPVALSLAALAGMTIGVAACVPHRELGSPSRGSLHSTRVATTIIGDCLEALAICKGLPRSREKSGVYYDGYDSSRRKDLLSIYLKKPDTMGP